VPIPIPIQSLTNPELQQFVIDHENDDEKNLVLKHKVILGVPSSHIASQIAGRRKSRTKIPSLYSTPNIIYPPGINLEQCSSEATAKFKAVQLNGDTFADLTGGFGIDTFFFSKKFKTAHYVESNTDLVQIVEHNHVQLQASNIQYHTTTAEIFLQTTDLRFDLMYIDPSRRATGNQKVFKLSDCEPNVISLQDSIFKKTEKLLIKVSPLLDLHQGLKELRYVSKVFVVSVDNECKEVLFLCEKNGDHEPVIEAVNITHDNIDLFSFYFSDERKAEVQFSDPLLYLYEPNASILKAGAFKSIGYNFPLKKIHPSTHLYTADVMMENFPGRIFKIQGYVKLKPDILTQYFADNKANITTRNYPLTPEQLKKKTGLSDGGEKYLIGFSGTKQKYLAAADRVK
jgi:16S rRNA G966 N2-methylase RsmD